MVVVPDSPIFSAFRKDGGEKKTKGDESPCGIPTWRNGHCDAILQNCGTDVLR